MEPKERRQIQTLFKNAKQPASSLSLSVFKFLGPLCFTARVWRKENKNQSPETIYGAFSKLAATRRNYWFCEFALKDQEWFEDLWAKKEILSEKQALFIWGIKDPVIGIDMLEKFRSAFRIHQTLLLDSCGHFPMEENPGEVSNALVNLLQD